MAMRYAISYKFIKKIIERACLKYSEKQNFAHPEALCPVSEHWGPAKTNN